MNEQHWVNAAEKLLLGKSIIKCRYMTRAEQQGLGWAHRPFVIALHDGTLLYASRDEECNDAGALFCDRQSIMSSSSEGGGSIPDVFPELR